MMNQSLKRHLTSCNILGKKTAHVTGFESSKYEINRIFNIVFLGVLIVSTMLLNALAVITIWKRTQLRKKLCYFVILVQSLADLTVGCAAMPVILFYLLVPFINVDICIAITLARSTIFLLTGLSIVTLSALIIERYIGVVHPYSYKKLTKTQIVQFVLCGFSILLSITGASVFSQHQIIKYAGIGVLAIFLIFITFAYVRIYLEMRRLSRSEVRPNIQGGKQNKDRKLKFREIKRAMSCFIVVISFLVLIVPYSLFPIFNQRFDLSNFNVYVWWTATLLNSPGSINSVIFFLRNTVLRKEAVKVMREILSSKNSDDPL